MTRWLLPLLLLAACASSETASDCKPADKLLASFQAEGWRIEPLPANVFARFKPFFKDEQDKPVDADQAWVGSHDVSNGDDFNMLILANRNCIVGYVPLSGQ